MIFDEKLYAKTLTDRGIDISNWDIKKLIEEGFDISQEAIDKAIDELDAFLEEGHSFRNNTHLGPVIGVTDKIVLFKRGVRER